MSQAASGETVSGATPIPADTSETARLRWVSNQPVTLAIVLPLCFLSGVFIPITELPHWLIDAAKIFPVHALADALLAAYNPHTTGSGLRWGDLAVLAAWGTAGLIIAVRRFRWLPRAG